MGNQVSFSTPSSSSGGGVLVSVQQASFTGKQTISTTNATFTDITNLSISVTTTTANQVVKLEAVVVGSPVGANGALLRLIRDATPVGVGVASGSQTPVGAASATNSNADLIMTFPLLFIDSPGAAGTYVYKAQASAATGGAANFYINGSSNGDTQVYNGAGRSTLIASVLSALTP